MARTEEQKLRRKEKDRIWRASLTPEERGVLAAKGRAYRASLSDAQKKEVNAYARNWRASNPEKDRRIRETRKLKEFGLTLEDFERMKTEQNGKCKICNREEQVRSVLSIDHCHLTGKVRGLLCLNCNSGLGMFNDDYSLVLKASEYLKTKETFYETASGYGWG